MAEIQAVFEPALPACREALQQSCCQTRELGARFADLVRLLVEEHIREVRAARPEGDYFCGGTDNPSATTPGTDNPTATTCSGLDFTSEEPDGQPAPLPTEVLKGADIKPSSGKWKDPDGLHSWKEDHAMEVATLDDPPELYRESVTTASPARAGKQPSVCSAVSHWGHQVQVEALSERPSQAQTEGSSHRTSQASRDTRQPNPSKVSLTAAKMAFRTGGKSRATLISSKQLDLRKTSLVTVLELKQAKLGWTERIVRHNLFNIVIAGFVAINAAMLGLEIDNEAMTNYSIPRPVFIAMEVFFSILFSLELALRMRTMGCLGYCCRAAELHWHFMDMVLVAVSWFNVAMALVFGNVDMDESLRRILKTLRLVRILRILRVVRFLTHVRSVVVMIVGSLMSLLWLFFVLAMFTYAFAMILTDGASSWLNPLNGMSQEFDEDFHEVQDEFGTIPRTMLTLFECICNGISWGEVGKRTMKLGAGYFIVFAGYLFFATFSILNIVTGVFVDSAIQLAESDRMIAMERASRGRQKLHKSLMDLMADMDVDHNGCISQEEWELAMHDADIRTHLEVMGIPFHETLELFPLLDVSGDGMVEVSEFLDGIARVKGMARSLDVHKVIAQTTRILALLDPEAAGDQSKFSPMNSYYGFFLEEKLKKKREKHRWPFRLKSLLGL